MTIHEFIERFSNMDSTVMEDVDIKKYIPLQDKVMVCENIVNKLERYVGMDNSSSSFVEKKYCYILFYILLRYTSITFDELEITSDLYNEFCEIGADVAIMKRISQQDYRTFCKILDDMTTIRDAMIFKSMVSSPVSNNMTEELEKMIEMASKHKSTFDSITKMCNSLKK